MVPTADVVEHRHQPRQVDDCEEQTGRDCAHPAVLPEDDAEDRQPKRTDILAIAGADREHDSCGNRLPGPRQDWPR